MNEVQMKKLEQQAIEQMKKNSSRSSGMTNKTVLVELLTATKTNRLIAPVKATTLWFMKTGSNPTEAEYKSKITSIKNSLDTLVSNFNNDDKIEADKLLNGHKLINDVNGLQIVKQ